MSDLPRLSAVAFDHEHGSPPSAVVAAIQAACGRRLRAIEIGTAYGEQLDAYASLRRVVCVDPMYDWVPDVPPGERFDCTRVDQKKLARWLENAGRAKNATLFVGVSHEMCDDETFRAIVAGSDVIIVDGCHHPWRAPAEDYTRNEALLADVHIAIFDDVQDRDPMLAAENVARDLRKAGHIVEQRDFHFPRLAVTARALRVERKKPER